MCLEHLVELESQEVLKTSKHKTTEPTMMGRGGGGRGGVRSVGATQEGTETTPSSQSWNNLSNETDNVVLGYNPKHKITTHESIFI